MKANKDDIKIKVVKHLVYPYFLVIGEASKFCCI